MQTKETMVSPRQKILSNCGEKENGIVSEDLPKTCKALQALIAVVQDLKQQQRARGNRMRTARLRRLRCRLRRGAQALHRRPGERTRSHRLPAGLPAHRQAAARVRRLCPPQSERDLLEPLSPCLRHRLAESLCALCGQRHEVGEEHRGVCALEPELRPVVQDAVLWRRHREG